MRQIQCSLLEAQQNQARDASVMGACVLTERRADADCSADLTNSYLSGSSANILSERLEALTGRQVSQCIIICHLERLHSTGSGNAADSFFQMAFS